MKKLSKLSAAILCIGMMGGAMAQSYNRDTVPSTKPMSQQSPTSGEGMPSTEWQTRQWDKKQWDGMTTAQRDEYKQTHKKWWNKMTPAEKQAARDKYKGQTNYMDKNWDSDSMYKGQ